MINIDPTVRPTDVMMMVGYAATFISFLHYPLKRLAIFNEKQAAQTRAIEKLDERMTRQEQHISDELSEIRKMLNQLMLQRRD